MRIDPEDLRRHYQSISDEEFLTIEREELTEIAQRLYDEELARRGLTPGQKPDSLAAPDEVQDAEGDLDLDNEPPPDWLDDAVCACAFAVVPGVPYSVEAGQARSVLRRAGIPCYVTLNQPEPSGDTTPRSEYCVMVPGAFNLHAASVLDRDIFNARQEEDWRAHLEALSDEELCAQKPEILCAGLLDRVARLQRVYHDEIAQRGLKPR